MKGDLIPEEAEIVRWIFGQFQSGAALTGIARDLTAQEVPARRGGDTWPPSSVRSILTNPRYAGRAVYKGAPNGAPGKWTAIVTPEEFDMVQARLADPRRKTNKLGTERKHLGSGLYLCHGCGRPVTTNGPRYWCKRGHVARSGAHIDKFVTDVVVAKLSSAEAVFALIPSNIERVSELEAKAAQLRARILNFENDYLTGEAPARLVNEGIAIAEAELKLVETELVSNSAGHAVASLFTGGDPGSAFAEASLSVRRATIRALMEVTLLPGVRGRRGFDPDSVRIEWRNPEFN